jgi:hypothetical protein
MTKHHMPKHVRHGFVGPNVSGPNMTPNEKLQMTHDTISQSENERRQAEANPEPEVTDEEKVTPVKK